MNDNKMIDDKIHEFQNMISDLNWKRVVAMIGFIISTAIATFGAAVLYEIARECTLPFIAFSSFFPMTALYSYQHKGNLKESYHARIKHLKRIKQDGIIKDDEVDKKRLKKIEKIEQSLKSSNKKAGVAAVVGMLSGLLGFIGVGTSFIKPSTIPVSFLGMLGFGISCLVEDKYLKKKYLEQAKVDNIKDDLIYGPVYGHTEKEKEKIEIKEEQLDNSKAIVNPNYLDAVEQYIKELSDQDVLETSYQKVKK